MKTYPVHVRIKDDDRLIRWSNMKMFYKVWLVGAVGIIILYSLGMISSILNQSMSLYDVSKSIFFVLAFSLFIFLLFRANGKAKAIDGCITFADTILFKVSDDAEEESIEYNSVYAIYRGTCPMLEQLGVRTEGEPGYRRYHGNYVASRIDDDRWNEYYGNDYIVAKDDIGKTLFAFTYHKEAFELLRERCPECLWFPDRDSCYRHIKSLPTERLGYNNSIVADLADFSNDIYWS